MLTMQAAVLALAVTGAGETVLYDFSAPWCGPCRQMDPIVERLRQAGHPVQQINIDQDRAKATQFGISTIPCFVMMVDGREVDRVVGAASQARLEQMLSKASRRDSSANSTLPSAPAVQVHGTTGATAGLPSSAAESAIAGSRQATPGDLVAASVRLKVQDPDGFSCGSGTIIDARAGEALILTCGHIFRDSAGAGPITVDLFAPGAPRGIEGTLIRYDLTRDLGLVSIRPGTAVPVVALAGDRDAMRPGDPVMSVGCDNGHDPTARASRIASVNRYVGPPNVQVHGQPTDGRSGGGLFDAAGRLIGVCYAGDPSDNEGLYTAIAAVRAELTDAGLTDLLRSDPSEQFATENSLVAVDAATTRSETHFSTPRGLEGATAGLSRSAQENAPRAGGESPRFSRPDAVSLTGAHAAAIADLAGGRDGAEVICIVRPLDHPGAKSDVFVIDKPSAEFLDRLSAERRRQEDRQLTSFRLQDNGTGGFKPNWLPARK